MYSIKGSKQYDDAWKWSMLILYVGIMIYILHRDTGYNIREPILYYWELLRFVEHFVLAVFCFRAFATIWKKRIDTRVFVACFLFAIVEEVYKGFLNSSFILLELLKDLLISVISIGLGILLARMQRLSIDNRKGIR